MPKTTFQLLEARLKADLGIEVMPGSLQRTRAGHWREAAGDWVWSGIVLRGNAVLQIGSCEPASLCIRKDHRLVADESFAEGGIHITAEKIEEVKREHI